MTTALSEREQNDRRNYSMINLHESMGPGRDRTRDPWICSQTRICWPRHVTDCATRPGTREIEMMESKLQCKLSTNKIIIDLIMHLITEKLNLLHANNKGADQMLIILIDKLRRELWSFYMWMKCPELD